MAVHYFLVCHILPLLTLGQTLEYGRQGFHTTLSPVIPGTPEKILWTHEGRKVVEFDGSEEHVYGTFQDRVVLDWHTAALTIRDLQGRDSGPYELEATVNTKKYYSPHDVAVIDKVAVPTISCVVNGTGGGGGDSVPQTLAALKCSAEGPPSLITYHWTLARGVHDGPELPVSLAGEQDEAVYTCLATNPVSQEVAKFVAKDCYPDQFSYTGLIVGVVGGIFLLLILAECLWCYRKWKKAHPKHDDIPDVEKQPWHRPSQGPDNMRTHDEDKERESLLYNGSTLPSSQPLGLLSHSDLAMQPLDSTSEQEEGDTTNSNRVSVHSSETKRTESHHSTDLDSKSNAGDSICELNLESESNLPPAASSVGCGVQPVVTELDATQTLERTNTDRRIQAFTEPEKRQEAAVSGMPPSDESVLASESPQDSKASRLLSTSLEDLKSSALKTTDNTMNANPSPSPALQETTSDNQSDSDISPPQPHIPRDDHLGSNEGSKEAHADLFGSDLTTPGPATVALQEDVAAHGPLSFISSPEVVEEEEKEEEEVAKEEEKTDTGVACISTGDEPSDECLVAADDPQVNVEALTSEVKEEVNDTKAPHGDAEVQEKGEVEEGDGKDGGLAGLMEPVSEPETHRDSEAVAGESDTSMEEEETLGTPEDKHENAKDGTREVGFSAEPGMETPKRKEEEDNDVAKTLHGAEVQEESEVEDGGREGEMTGLTETESGPETRRDSDSEPGESGSGQVETQGMGGNHEEVKDETGKGPLSDHEDIEEVERRDVNKDAEMNAKKESITE